MDRVMLRSLAKLRNLGVSLQWWKMPHSTHSSAAGRVVFLRMLGDSSATDNGVQSGHLTPGCALQCEHKSVCPDTSLLGPCKPSFHVLSFPLPSAALSLLACTPPPPQPLPLLPAFCSTLFPSFQPSCQPSAPLSPWSLASLRSQ